MNSFVKVLAPALAVGFLMAGCNKEGNLTNPTPTTPTTNGGNNTAWKGQLEPKAENRVILLETTGAWCGYCPNGAEELISQVNANGRVLGVALHTGDALTTPTVDTMLAFFTASGVPNFYVGNDNADQNPGSLISSYINAPFVANVGHQFNDKDGKIEVKTRVAFDQAGAGEYYLGVYAIQKEVESRMSANLDQSDYTSRLANRFSADAEGNPDSITYWMVDAANGVIKANDAYTHEHVMTKQADGMAVWGKKILTDPAAGAVHQDAFTITREAQWGEMQVLTVLWKRDGTSWKYINGYLY